MNRRSFFKTSSASIATLILAPLILLKAKSEEITISFLNDHSFLGRDMKTVKRTSTHNIKEILRIWEIKKDPWYYGYVQFKPTIEHNWGKYMPAPYYPIPTSEYNKLKELGITIKNGSNIK